MADLPHHPDGDEDPAFEADRAPKGKASWKTYLFVAVGVALVLLMVVLHLAGVVGPGSH